MGWSLHRKPGLTFHNPAYSFKGYTIATPIGGDSIFLLDMAGRVVHRWRFADVRPEYAYLTERGTLLYRSLPPPDAGFRFKPAQEDDPPMPLEERARVLPSNYRFLTEADWEGETLWRHEDPLLHHDFWLTKQDTFLVSRFVQMDKGLSDRVRGAGRARKSHHPMLTDEYLELNRAGEVVWSVRLDELLDPKLDPLGVLERRIEWTHTNSICQDDAGERVLFSCKNANRVGIIDKATKTLAWRFGHPTTSSQHHARWLPNGNVHLFDNGTRREGLPFSRVIEVDPKTSAIVWEYQANPPMAFFSPHISSADRLPNGNTFICEGGSGRVFEVTRRGETVWEWHNPFAETVRGSQTSFALWRAHRYAPDHPALAGKDLDPARYRALNDQFGLV
ncbi:MAG TPA: aryl-sulfate sulfotransferase [Caulobacteraceae bacterium]|nr:aryl-sulfate sulfotransferase [Caulobacteraceae bacterium]